MKHLKLFEELGFDDPTIKDEWNKQKDEFDKEQKERRDTPDDYISNDDLDKNISHNNLYFDKKYLHKLSNQDIIKNAAIYQNITEMLKIYLVENIDYWQDELNFKLTAFDQYDITYHISGDGNDINFRIIHIDGHDDSYYIELDEFLEFYNIHLSHNLIK